MKNDWLENVGVFIREMFWLEPNLFPYKYPNILKPVILRTYLPMKMERTECSETSAYKIQTPGNYPEESIRHSEHGESLKSPKHTLSLSACSLLFFCCASEVVSLQLCPTVPSK